MQPLARAITVQGDDGCIDWEAAAQRVAAWLGRGTVDARVRVRVRASAGTLRFDMLRNGRESAERQFAHVPAACPDRQAALGLAVALAIDSTILGSLGVPAPPSEPRSDEASLAVEVGGLGLWQVVPNITAGVEAGVEVAWRRLGLAVSGMASVPTRVQVPPGSARITLVGGRIDGCIYDHFDWVRVAACPGIAAGLANAEGAGYDQSKTADLLWVAASLRLAARIQLAGPFGVEPFIQGLVPIVRPVAQVTQGVDGPVVAEKTFPIAGAALGLDLVLDFQ